MPQPITKPGFYPGLSMDAYLADPCPEPSLSSGIARTLIDRTPLHAWTAHPRLNPSYERETKEVFDIGTAFHDLLLKGESYAVRVDANDWRTKAAKEERDEIRAAGKIPLLPEQYDRTFAMHAAFLAQITGNNDFDFREGLAKGKTEVTGVWLEEKGLRAPRWCRMRLDLVAPGSGDKDWGFDIKTTANASPATWGSRTIWQTGATFQGAFYPRGYKAIRHRGLEWRNLVIETGPPHALAIFAPAPDVIEYEEERVEKAIRRWDECMAEDRWPAYPALTTYVELPAFLAYRRLDANALEDYARARGKSALDLMIQMQAPIGHPMAPEGED